MRCWHELLKIFDEEKFEGIYSVLTTITPSSGGVFFDKLE